MAVQHFPDRLIKRLPQVRGQLIKNADLAKLTWFGSVALRRFYFGRQIKMICRHSYMNFRERLL